MKSLGIALLVFGFQSAFANVDSVSQMTVTATPTQVGTPNTNQGNIQLGGGFGWTQYNSRGSSTTSYTIRPQAEYFVMDRLSVGGTLSLGGQSANYSYTSVGLGPSASYYFYQVENVAFYGAQEIAFTKYSDGSKVFTNGTTSVGAKFFLVPQVAFGVALAAGYGLGGEDNNATTNSVGGNFSFYY